MIIVVQCIIYYGLVLIKDIEITLSPLGITFLMLATVLIAAGGLFINDFYGQVADKINRPKGHLMSKSFDEKQVKLAYFLCTFSGLGLGFILTNLMEHPFYFFYFAVSTLLLYIYARFLKKIAFLGNLMMGLLTGLSVLLVPIFELLPAVSDINKDTQMSAFYFFVGVSLFTFATTLVIEIANDIKNIQGDHVAGYKTLPILLGAQRSAKISVVLILLMVTVLSWCTFTFFYDYKITVAVVFFTVIAPLGYCCTKLWEATKKSELSHVSLILKVIMFVGICTSPLQIYAIYYA